MIKNTFKIVADVVEIDVSTVAYPQSIALIDASDFDFVFDAPRRWFAGSTARGVYVFRNSQFSGRRSGQIRLHRKLLGDMPVGSVGDHINGNGLDNRRANLRVATIKQNARNRHTWNGTTSKFRGVSFDAQTGRWRAQICVDQKTINLGRFLSEIEAAQAYDREAAARFGEFANPNFSEAF